MSSLLNAERFPRRAQSRKPVGMVRCARRPTLPRAAGPFCCALLLCCRPPGLPWLFWVALSWTERLGRRVVCRRCFAQSASHVVLRAGNRLGWFGPVSSPTLPRAAGPFCCALLLCFRPPVLRWLRFGGSFLIRGAWAEGGVSSLLCAERFPRRAQSRNRLGWFDALAARLFRAPRGPSAARSSCVLGLRGRRGCGFGGFLGSGGFGRRVCRRCLAQGASGLG